MGNDLQFIMTLVKTIMSLLFILFLIFISFKYGGNKLDIIQRKKYMRVIYRLAISRDNSILVVKIGDKGYVMSSTQSRVEILFKLDDEEISKIESMKETNEYEGLKNLYEKLKNKKEDKYEKS